MTPRDHPTPADIPVRLAHFSDIHLTTRHPGWRLRDLWTKRLTGWLNLTLLGRQSRFLMADEIVRTFRTEWLSFRPDRVIFSGDATTLGFAAELTHAATVLGLKDAQPFFGLAVPGNHDLYVRQAVETGLFERSFAPWLTGERVDDATYPFAQRVGPVWLVAVNSSVPNHFAWDARGKVGAEQLARLKVLLQRLAPGPRILVTHYPVCRADGAREGTWHGLRDLDPLIAVAVRGGICLWLHGHRHQAYHCLASDRVPFPVLCAGSLTQKGAWSYQQYTITGQHCHAVRRTYNPVQQAFHDAGSFDLDLNVRGAGASINRWSPPRDPH